MGILRHEAQQEESELEVDWIWELRSAVLKHLIKVGVNLLAGWSPSSASGIPDVVPDVRGNVDA